MTPPTPEQTPPVGSGSDLSEMCGFTRANAARVARATEFIEGFTRHGRPRPSRPWKAWKNDTLKVYTTSGGVPAAAAANTPGVGTGNVCEWDGTSWVPGGDVVTLLNPSTGADVAGSAYVTVSAVGGLPADTYEVTLEPC